MKRYLPVLILLSFSFLACVHPTCPVAPAPTDGPTKITLQSAFDRDNAHFRVLTALVDGDVESTRWWCPETIWDFGDGEHEVHQEDCHAESGPDHSFVQSHLYKFPGPYSPTFTVRYRNRRQYTVTGTLCVLTCSANR